jgi:hypothetical protein
MKVFAWDDVGGWDYWINKEKSENGIWISVEFKHDDVPISVLKQLESDIRETVRHFEQYESYRKRDCKET